MRLLSRNSKTAESKKRIKKIAVATYYPCSNIAVRHICMNHCRKCYFEAAYCPK
jgi:hypothetical protein